MTIMTPAITPYTFSSRCYNYRRFLSRDALRSCFFLRRALLLLLELSSERFSYEF